MRGQKVMDTFYDRLKETWSYHTHHPGLPVRVGNKVLPGVVAGGDLLGTKGADAGLSGAVAGAEGIPGTGTF